MIRRHDDQEFSIRESMRGGNGVVELTGLIKPLPEKARMFSLLRLVPGTSIGYHVHENETEMFYFVEGCARVCDNGTYYDVCEGDAMATYSGQGHGVENTGDRDLVIVAVVVKD